MLVTSHLPDGVPVTRETRSIPWEHVWDEEVEGQGGYKRRRAADGRGTGWAGLMTFEEIGAVLGLSRYRVHAIYKEAIRKLRVAHGLHAPKKSRAGERARYESAGARARRLAKGRVRARERRRKASGQDTPLQDPA